MRRSRFPTQRFRPFSGALAFAAPLALYAASAYRDVTYWDVGEMDTVPYILGIAHPPGLPLYTLLGWAFAHALPLGSVAFRMSLLSALAMSVAAWFVFAMVEDVCEDVVAALASSWLFACGAVAWSVGTRADVHACETALFCALAWAQLRWYRDVRTGTLYTVAVLFGLAVAMHPIGIFALPGILVAILARAPACDARTLARAIAVACASAAVWFVYLPLRSAYVDSQGLDPLVAIGLHGSAFWDYDHPVVASNFVALVGGGDVHPRGAWDATALLWAILREFTLPGMALAALGVWALVRRDATSACVLGALCAGSAIFACGFSNESDPARYLLPAMAAACVCAGAGIAWLRASAAAIPATIATAVLVGWLVATQPAFFAQPHDERARRDVAETLSHTPNDAIVVAGWSLAPALAYSAYVERASGDRLIVPSWYGEVADQLDGWVASRPVYVAGAVEGSVPGYRLERLPTHTPLYHVVRE